MEQSKVTEIVVDMDQTALPSQLLAKKYWRAVMNESADNIKRAVYCLVEGVRNLRLTRAPDTKTVAWVSGSEVIVSHKGWVSEVSLALFNLSAEDGEAVAAACKEILRGGK